MEPDLSRKTHLQWRIETLSGDGDVEALNGISNGELKLHYVDAGGGRVEEARISNGELKPTEPVCATSTAAPPSTASPMDN